MASCWKCKKERKRNWKLFYPVQKPEDKKALMIGLNYPNSHFSLRGCINDVKEGSAYFQSFGYTVKMLTDQNIKFGNNVLDSLKELGEGEARKLVFHYSGHGTQVKDLNGDEIDGLDEALYLAHGQTVTDDQINQVISSYSADKTVFMIWDCCHSGTIVDLPYVYTETSGVQTEFSANQIKAKVIAISGCQDPQTSSDVTEHFKSYGALSNTLYGILKQKKKCSWKQLYHQLLVEMKRKGYQQYPVLSASDPKLFYQQVEF